MSVWRNNKDRDGRKVLCLQLGFGERDVDDFAKGDEGVVEGLGGDLVVEAADVDCGFLLSGQFGHDVFLYFFSLSCRGFRVDVLVLT